MKELPKDLLNLPLDFIKKIGNFPAPLLYTPAEVAESFTLNILERVNFKIGQAQERVYDKYLIGKMSSLRLKQSVALNSTKQKPITVTPYIDKEKQKSEVRLFFGESTESLKEKLNSIPKDNYIYSVDNNFGQVLNPIVEKAVYAVESALCQGNEYVEVFGQKIYSGEDLINFLSLKTIPFDQILVEIEPLIKKYILDINSKS